MRSHPRLFIVLYLLSGAAALLYEVAWLLTMSMGHTTAAVGAVLAAFMGGLAIGSWLGGRLSRDMPARRALLTYAALESAIAVCALLLPFALTAARPLLVSAYANGNGGPMFDAVRLLVAIVLIALPAGAMGASFPVGIVAIGNRDAGKLYAANTAGAIAGALAGSFILVPRLGLQPSLQVASILAVLAGVFVAWRAGSSGRARAAVALAAAATLAFAIAAPQWNHERLAGGAYRFAPALAAGDVATALEAGELTYYREGAPGTVSVRQLLGVTSLAIDGKVDASNGADMLTQKLLAHLPLLLHHDPHSVYIIGLGSGVTLGSALSHPIDRAVVSEISSRRYAWRPKTPRRSRPMSAPPQRRGTSMPPKHSCATVLRTPTGQPSGSSGRGCSRRAAMRRAP